FLRVLDAGDDVTNVAAMHFILLRHLHLENANFIGLVFLASGDKLYDVTLLERSIENSVIHNDSSKRIEHAVEDQRLQRRAWMSCCRRNAVDNCIQHVVTSESCSRARVEDLLSRAANEVYELVSHFFHHRTIRVDLVDAGNDLAATLAAEVEI